MEDYEPEYLESMEGCEEYLKEFFSGRALFSQKAAHDEQQKNHDEKYERELQYDKRDNAKGKGPYFKQYRKDNINQNSNCDAQYVNNLHAYFGDGSKLKQTPKKIHYAVDLICPNAVDTDATAALKNLEVSRNKKKVLSWVRANRENIRRPFRRAVSCCDLRIEIPSESQKIEKMAEKIGEKPPNPYDSSLTLNDLDPDFDAFFSSNKLQNRKSYYLRELAFTIKSLMSHVNAYTKQVGVLQISKVLFSRPDLYGYVLPADKDPQRLLREFSAQFEQEMKESTKSYRDNFGLFRPNEHQKFLRDGTPEPYYWNKNVILLLEEFSKEGTKYRRARHVCRVWNAHQLYLEIDTGMLRIVESTTETVRRMPKKYADTPTPILEIRFQGVETPEEMSTRIADLRKTGRAFIGHFESRNSGDSNQAKEWNYKSRHAVLLPIKKPPAPRLTTFFCDELYCMGLCACTDKFLQKIEVPLTPVGTPTAWIADKEQKKDKKKRFEFPTTNHHHLQPIQPLMSSFSSPKKTSTTQFKSTLEPANMSSFFQR